MKYTLDQKRSILESAGSKFFSAVFVKQDGTIREMTCKKYIEAYLHGKPGENKSTVSHKPEYFVVAEMAKKGYRTINMETLISCKVDGITYKFEETKF